ncbi:MAG: hypothetical protein NT007_17815 [Candidatus Kapabacteria bacterium]|nr:hypothetical protein [Candidatus Kapabacteria bacterium]
MKQEVNIIEGPCDYLEEDIQPEYDFTNAQFYHLRDKPAMVEIEPEVFEYFGSAAKINHILKSIKETMVQ